MIIKKLTDTGVLEIIPNKFHDSRGYFMETFRHSHLSNFSVKQENTSMSLMKGTLRGIHMQLNKHSQAKLVSCLQGKILDVYVDLRKNSNTFGAWGSIVLDASKNNQVFIPKGFGHGFVTLTNNSVVSYKCNAYYNKESEYTIAWNDKSLNIDWRIAKPILNTKDSLGKSIEDYKAI